MAFHQGQKIINFQILIGYKWIGLERWNFLDGVRYGAPFSAYNEYINYCMIRFRHDKTKIMCPNYRHTKLLLQCFVEEWLENGEEQKEEISKLTCQSFSQLCDKWEDSQVHFWAYWCLTHGSRTSAWRHLRALFSISFSPIRWAGLVHASHCPLYTRQPHTSLVVEAALCPWLDISSKQGLSITSSLLDM